MAEKTYVARRELKVGEGFIYDGELYPPSQVTSSLLSVGWVVEGTGPLPRDKRTHEFFPAGTTGTRKTRVARDAPEPEPPPAGLADLPTGGPARVPEPEDAVPIRTGEPKRKR